MTPEQQRDADRAEIKIKLIGNGVLVKTGADWFAFDTWEKASEHIADRIKALQKPHEVPF